MPSAVALRNAAAFVRTKKGFGLGMAAQVVSQVVAVAIQFGLIPVLIRVWGAPVLGAWLAISAIPTYLNLSNLGFTQVAANDMTSAVNEGQLDAADVTLQSVAALLSVSFMVFSPLFLALVWLTPLLSYLRLESVDVFTARATISFLVGGVLVAQAQGLLTAHLQATKRFYQGVLWIAAARLGEAAALLVTALSGGSLPECALAGLAGRSVMTALNLAVLSDREGSFHIDLRQASWSEVRRLAGPSLSYMLVPVSSSLVLQGPILVLSALLGPVAVAAFSITRTLTRVGFQFMNMINSAATPEYAAARSRVAEFYRTLRWHLFFAAAISIAYIGAFMLLGQQAVEIYSHHAIHPPPLMIWALAVAVAVEFLWNSGLTALVAINRHMRLAAYGFISSIMFTGVAFFATKTGGVSGMALSVVAYNALMLAVVAVILRHDMRRLNTP